MIAILRSARRKVLGETRAIPLGVATTILLAYPTQSLLPNGEWQTAGAFALAAAIIATLTFSLPAPNSILRRAKGRARPATAWSSASV